MKLSETVREAQAFEAQPSDYDGLFANLEWFVKPVLAREIDRRNLNNHAANMRWLAWVNIQQLVQAVHAAGLTVPELHGWVVEWGREWKAMENGELKMEGNGTLETAKT